LRPTRPQEVAGTLPSAGRPETLEEMDTAITAEVKQRHASCLRLMRSVVVGVDRDTPRIQQPAVRLFVAIVLNVFMVIASTAVGG
jgi:hypothetical protein